MTTRINHTAQRPGKAVWLSLVTALCLLWGVDVFAQACSVTVNNGTMCAQNAPVQLNAVASGAATYSWSPSAGLNATTGANVSAWHSVAGTYNYTVTATFSNGCTASDVATVTVMPLPTISVSPSPGMVCSGQPITVCASGAVTYEWYPDYCISASTGACIEASTILTTNYMVIGTSAAGCQGVAPFTINSGVTPIVVLDPAVASCGPNSGAVTAFAFGGAFSFSYQWSGPNGFTATSQSIDSLQPGFYSVTVLDYSGCSSTANTVVSQSTPPTVTPSFQTATCYQSNGGIDIEVAGGTPPYTYAWSNAATTQDIQNVAPGDYTVSVADAAGCTMPVDLTVPTTPSPSLSFDVTDATCGQANGQVDVTVVDGTLPYNFQWNPGPASQNLAAAGAGSYTLNFTDALGCTAAGTATVNTTAAPVLSTVITHTTCSSNNGAVDLTATGDGPLSFAWSVPANTEDVSNLAAADYTVTVTDVNGCTALASATVNSSALPELSFNVTDESCSAGNGSITVNASNGTAPYTFAWDNGGTAAVNSSLSAGTYAVTVTDANGCTVAGSATVVDSPSPTLGVVVVNETCGASNGSIDLTPTGAGPFTFVWSPGGATTEDINGLTDGTYDVIVTDANGCTGAAPVVLTDSPLPQFTYTAAASTCGNANGTVDVTVTAGQSPYQFIWSNALGTDEDLTNVSAGTYTLTVTDAFGCSASQTVAITNTGAPQITVDNVTGAACGQSIGSVDISISGGTAAFTYNWNNNAYATQDLSGIPNGTYTVIVTDANGCTATETVVVTDASTPAIEFVVTDATCGLSNGAINTTVTGGTGAYTFNWNPGNEEDLNNVPAGSYNLTVTDAVGCSASASITVNGSTAPSLSAAVQNATCNQSNGAIDLTVNNGTGPFDFQWAPANGNVEDLVNLSGGNFNVTVTDANGCTAALGNLVVNIVAVPGLNALVTHTACGLNNGAIDLTVSGSTGPYAYAWSQNAGTSEDLNNLAAGNYTITVTDANACTLTGTYVVNASQGINLNASATPSQCGVQTGSVTVTAANGTAPYTYAWTGGATTQTVTNLAAGDYNVTVYDDAGCSATASATVTNPSAPALIVSVSDAACDGANGSVDVTVQGGIAPYDFAWTNGATTEDISAVSAGLHVLTVTDANNCTATAVATVQTTTGVTLDVVINEEICSAGNGSVDLTAAGVGPFTYNWNNQYFTEDLTNVSANTYNVTVTADNNCTASLEALVTNIPCAPSVSLTATDATCGLNNGAIELTISGGALPYVFQWSANTGNATTQNVTNLAPGQYFVTVTDGNNLQNVYDAVVNAGAAPTVSVSTAPATCGIDNGTASANVAGGTAPYAYSWSNNGTGTSLIGLAPASYTVTVTDAIGCTVSATGVVNNVAAPTLQANTVSTQCNLSNGSIDLTVNGGATPFTYLWNNNATTQDLTSVGAGTYAVTVSDGNGCTVALVNLAVGASTAPSVLLSATSSTCGNANGTATATATNGAAPYAYTWTPNVSVTASAANLIGGSYTVTVTDNAGCTASATVNVTDIAAPSINAALTPEACNQSNGAIDVTVAGGTGPIDYAWSTQDVSQDINGLTAGNYALTVTDANGCSAVASFDVAFAAAPQLAALVTPATCNADNGAIDLTVSGGAAPVAFAWSNNQNTEDIAQLSAGNYSVTVTDANNCTATIQTSVNAIVPGVVSVSGIPAAVCEAQSFQVTANGAVTYVWTPAAGLSAATGDVVTVTAFDAVVYTVTGTDANGCVDTATFNVAPNPLPEVSVAAGPYKGCAPFNATFEADTANAVSVIWFFNTLASSTELSPTLTFESGLYDATLIAVSAAGCADTVLLPDYVQVLESPEAGFVATSGEGTADNPSTTFFFDNHSSNATAYDWNFGDSTNIDSHRDPSHTYALPGEYLVTLIATNKNGCTDTFSLPLVVQEPRRFFVPNTFSPNGDGNNDFFTLYGYNVESFRLRVYDRSGEKVYDGHQGSEPWDGTMHGKGLNAGVYIYMAEVKYDTGMMGQQWGDVTLLR